MGWRDRAQSSRILGASSVKESPPSLLPVRCLTCFLSSLSLFATGKDFPVLFVFKLKHRLYLGMSCNRSLGDLIVTGHCKTPHTQTNPQPPKRGFLLVILAWTITNPFPRHCKVSLGEVQSSGSMIITEISICMPPGLHLLGLPVAAPLPSGPVGSTLFSEWSLESGTHRTLLIRDLEEEDGQTTETASPKASPELAMAGKSG